MTVDLARDCWLIFCCSSTLRHYARALIDWSCLQQSQSETLWRRIQSQALRLFMRLFPWIHATQEGLKFGYQLLYLLDSTPFYTPVLHLLGQNIVRVSGQEMVSHAAIICLLRYAACHICVCTHSYLVQACLTLTLNRSQPLCNPNRSCHSSAKQSAD